MLAHRTITALSQIALALSLSACGGGVPAVCDEVRSCCESLDPGLSAQCQQAFERAVELDAEAAKQQCESSLAAFRLAGQCGGSNDGGPAAKDGGTAPLDGGAQPDLPPSQGLSQPCDPSHGIDACGASLFCAAFDGRTVPTCCPEGIRRSGEACGEDRHCATHSCHAEQGRCRAASYDACEVELGCSERTQFCSARAGSCQAVGDGTSGSRCGLDAHCQSGYRCEREGCWPSRQDNSPCRRSDECEGGRICTGGSCGWGREEGDACQTDAHCEGGLRCENLVCTRPRGGTCQIARDECRSGESCQLTSVSPEGAMCTPEGPATRGQTCGVGHACSGDTTCLAFEEVDGRCFAPCDPEVDDACGAGWNCLPMHTLSFGICLELRCTPFSCAANEVCDQTFDIANQELLGCAPAGTTPLGGACGSTRCAAPGFCVDFGPGPRCATPCDAEHACASGSCIWLGGAEFGVCE